MMRRLKTGRRKTNLKGNRCEWAGTLNKLGSALIIHRASYSASILFFFNYCILQQRLKKRRSVESERETGPFSLLIAPAIVDGSAKEEKRLKYKKMRRGMLLVRQLLYVVQLHCIV
jgi:hypothetical protein